MTRCSLVALSAAVLVGRAAGDALEVTEATWDKEVKELVDNGGLVFAKFLAPW